MTYTVQFLNFFLQSVLSVLSTDYLHLSYQREVCFVQTRKAHLNPFSLPNESCSLCQNSLRYRRAKVINFLLETGLGTVDFSIRIKRKTLKHLQHVIVKYQISNFFFQ